MKNNVRKIGILLLVAIVAIGSYYISGTYAKYTSEIAGSDTATVAKWAWQFGDDVIDSVEDATNGYTFDLFNTIKDTNSTSPFGVSSSDETDVASGKIAPGTGGSFEIAITNLSEVNAQYAIAFTEVNANNVPIEYSVDGSTWIGTVGSLNVSATDIAMAGGTYNSNDNTDTLTVYWRWAYIGAESTNYTETQTDVTDTALGFAANTTAPTVQVTATVTVTQVN